MDQQQIKAFIDAMQASDLSEMEFSQDGWTLKLTRNPTAGKAASNSQAPQGAARATSPTATPLAPSSPLQQPAMATSKEVAAPLYGVVHFHQAPGDPPFVAAGQVVKTGQTLCVIEAMKVFNEVRAEFDGTVVELLVTTGQEVEAGQPLLRFE